MGRGAPRGGRRLARGPSTVPASSGGLRCSRRTSPNPAYFHKVVDCQWACPAHTPVPEYIRLIAQGRYGDAYMVNWVSNVFPGILGRTCDRPCEPACRRGRVEENNAEQARAGGDLPPEARGGRHEGRRARAHAQAARRSNGKRIACVGAGPASLTVARDLAPLGYEVTVFDGEAKAGGFIRTQIPRFRLPESVIDEETGYILDLGVEFRGGAAHRLDEGADGAGLRRHLRRLRRAARARPRPARAARRRRRSIHIGIDWLASVSFGHVTEHRPARDRAGRRQHGDGLLPLGAPPGRRRT